MKKFLCLITAIILMITVTACSGETPKSTDTSTSSTTDNQSTDQSENEIASPSFFDSNEITTEELQEIVIDQSNRHNLNAFCYDNTWIYGAWGGESAKGEIVKVRYDNSDWTVIDSDTNGYLAACQAVKSGYIYYSQPNDKSCELIKVRSSGEDPKVIIPEQEGAIQIVDNYIYYTTKEIWEEDNSAVTQESSHLYRCNLDGENAEAILEKPVFNFTVFNNYVLYQDDKDNMTLHIYNIETKEDKQINTIHSFIPIYDGEYIYYLSDSNSDEAWHHKMYRMTLDGSINEEIMLECYVSGYLMRGDYIYYINMDDNYRIYRCQKDGSDIELVT